MATILSAAMVCGAVARNGRNRGAIYARYSSRFQQSIEDQVRVCREWAENNAISVLDEHIFADRAKTGRTHKRKGFNDMLAAMRGDEIDVVITFATNRIYRKVYTRHFKRDEPLLDWRDERLRIMDDETFLRAQARLAERNRGGGRKKGDGYDSRQQRDQGIGRAGGGRRQVHPSRQHGHRRCRPHGTDFGHGPARGDPTIARLIELWTGTIVALSRNCF